MSRVFLSLVLVCFVSFSVLADTIRLKDGSIIKGRITGFSGGKFTITVGEGARQRTITYDASEVDSIEFDENAATPSSAVRVVTSDNNAGSNTARNSPRVIVSDTTKTDTPRPTGTPAQIESDVAVLDDEDVIDEDIDDSVDDTANSSAPMVRASSAQPITINVKVMADNTSNGWTNTGWVVRKGQRIRITGSGEISLGRGKMSGAAGLYDLDDNDKLLKAVPTGALIAVIGDDNNDFIYVGSSREFVAERDGALFLGINEGNLDDNSGTLDARIEILPDTAN
ncbi:MAG: hypothetical protein KF855_02780 [Acidobacteria bacterium]|nr:hypothetical protein [Acidobacteriota bacterium]